MSDAEPLPTGEGAPAGPDIAVVGMAGRFPGAPDVESLWTRLVAGEECVSFFTDEELAASGVPEAVRRHPAYVPARAIVTDPDHFDAACFGMNATEAKVTDPQHRMFLEVAWEALEDAGIDPSRPPGAIGVMAGADVNSYALGQLLVWTHDLQSLLGNDKDYLATRVAFKLDLKGPALTIQTACSTSLVATQVACQALLSYQCDVALAGGVGLAFPQKVGYLFQEGGILSPDGHCRAFDAQGRGTVGGDGCGVVVLKRLADAIAAGDPIRAVIKGIAINNDGADKMAFTAPSVRGQSEVVAMAHGMAAVSPDTIGYVECHGTATALGDPIEIAALDQVFAQGTGRRGYCPVGSIKTNVGHMNSAAGVGGLIKTVLTLERATIPPSLHFQAPNPRIDFERSCFYVNTRLQPWPAAAEHPRRAAVSSFGVGGTNAHAVLEEAPPLPVSSPARAHELLVLSAMDDRALAQAEARLGVWLEAHPDVNLGDLAWTLQTGRRRLPLAKAAVVSSAAEARAALARATARRTAVPGSARAVFLFPGQGAQHVGMMHGLYEQEPAFREALDACCEGLRPHLGLDLREAAYAPGSDESAAVRLAETAITQPLLFAVELALARLWRSLGVEPAAFLGHSVGELVAACLSGVFSLDDALRLVAARGRVMQGAPRGAMLAVMADEARAARLPGVEVAAANAPNLTVVAGEEAAIAEAEVRLKAEGVGTSRLRTSHAFHSRLLDGVLDAYRGALAGVAFGSPTIPWVSNLTGTWITPEEARSPDYWVRQARRAVRFADGVAAVLADPDRVLLEVGPGTSLSGLARQHPAAAGRVVVTGARQPRESGDDRAVLLEAAGALAHAGVALDWAALHGLQAGRRRTKLRLPTYPFQRQSYWQGFGELQARLAASTQGSSAPRRIADAAGQLHAMGWRRQRPLPAGGLSGRWLVLCDEDPLGPALADALGAHVEVATALNGRGRSGAGAADALGAHVEVATARSGRGRSGTSAADALGAQAEVATARSGAGAADALGAQAKVVTRSVTDLALDDAALDALLSEGWSGIALATSLSPIPEDREVVRRGAELLLAVVRAAARRGEGASPFSITLLARGLADLDGAALVPLRALARGVAQVAGQELRDVRVRIVDPGARPSLAALLGELAAGRDEPAFTALAGGHRWLPVPGPVPDTPASSALVEGGVYLITGGLGEVGLRLAEHLARTRRAKLVLTSRVGLLARGEWSGWLASHAPTDLVSRRIRRVQALEQAGAEVLTAAADVADEARMAELVAEVLGRWGRLDGAIHAAGLAGSAAFRAAADTTAGHLGEHLRAKVEGTRVLAKVLPASTRFALLMSSISTVLGGVGLLAYAAASHFLDALALGREGQPGPRFVSVAWDAWRPDGVKAEALDAVGLSSEEAVAAMERILALPGVPAAVVSTLPLETRIADVAAAGRALLERAGAGGRAPGTIHPRPELDTPFVAPRDDLEEAIAAIWRELFSLDRVGVQDSFFALGGDSLLAIQLGTRLRERLEVDLPINELFEQPTVESVARRVRAAQETARAQLRSTLEMVEGLSDAEVRAMLAKLERGEKAPAPAIESDARLVPERYHFEPGGPVDRGEVRRFYDSVSTQLDGSPYRDHALFLNYGYVPNDAPSFAAVALPAQLPSRNSIRLVVELMGRHPLQPSDRVLDVGCGRGGTVHVLRRFFTVGDVVGLDLSPVAVAFCRQRHGDARTTFVEGDAHHLPFPDQSFDVITNVESSHAYGDVDPFLAEVARVLRPGGTFLYTDVVAADAVGPRESRLAALGLRAGHRRDITPNVLLSCDETARMNARAFGGANDAGMLERFLAVPESDLYREMKAGRQRYMLYHLQRSP